MILFCRLNFPCVVINEDSFTDLCQLKASFLPEENINVMNLLGFICIYKNRFRHFVAFNNFVRLPPALGYRPVRLKTFAKTACGDLESICRGLSNTGI